MALYIVVLQVAKTLSLTYDKPLIGVHHIAGHIYANNYEKDIVYPALCLVVSGGHTELVLMKHPYSFEVIGETLEMMLLEKHMIKWEEF